MTSSLAGVRKSLPLLVKLYQAASDTALTDFGPIDLEPSL